MAGAGLWEGWKPPGVEEWIRTCTVITREPNELIREIHTRLPVILPENQFDAWLSGEAGKEILVPYPARTLQPYDRVTAQKEPTLAYSKRSSEFNRAECRCSWVSRLMSLSIRRRWRAPQSREPRAVPSQTACCPNSWKFINTPADGPFLKTRNLS